MSFRAGLSPVWVLAGLAMVACKSKPQPTPQPGATAPAPSAAPKLTPAEQQESAKLQAFLDWHHKNAADLLATIEPKFRECYDKADGDLYGLCGGMYVLPSGHESYSLDWVKAHPQATLATYTTNRALNLDCSVLSTSETRHFDAKWLKLKWHSEVCRGNRWDYLVEHFVAPTQSTVLMIFTANYPKYAKGFAKTLAGGKPSGADQ